MTYGHGILDAFARRRAHDAAVLAEYDGHQGPDLCAQDGVCQLPRPRQQRHCSGYEPDTGTVEPGRCLHKRGSSRCGKLRSDAAEQGGGL